MAPTITFLGTASVTPAAGGDTASFLIDRNILVDTGWYAPLKMLQYGFSPLEVDTVIFTHCHHDHYMGLPQLLFYRRMKRHEGALRIIGPEEDLARTVDLAHHFLQTDRYPQCRDTVELVPLAPGASLSTPEFTLDTIQTVHAVQGLCYRYTDANSRSSFGFTGDTAFHPPIARHLEGCDLILHEASHADKTVENAAATGHASAAEAARIAADAGATRLGLMHVRREDGPAALTAARRILPGAFWPMDGESVAVNR